MESQDKNNIVYQSTDILFRKSSPVEEKLNPKVKNILEAFWNLQAYQFKQVQILHKQAGQMLEISNAHEKYQTNSIFISKELLSFKKVLKQSFAQYFHRIRSYILSNSLPSEKRKRYDQI